MRMVRKTSLKLLLLTLIIANHVSQAQVNKPIRIDKAALSGLGLEKVVLSAEPEREFFQRRILRGEDLSIYIVSSQSWTARMDNFAIDEVVYMLNGKAKIKPDSGDEMSFQSNEFFFIPKGYTGSWQILANDSYHYELSIIATNRAPSPDPKKITPELLDKDVLSGIDITLDNSGSYHKVLTKGVELTVSLKAESPKKKELSTPAKEQIIHVLSGQIGLIDYEGDEHTFNTGDFFVLPKGFTGSWHSKGHGLIKYLVIQKTA